MIIALFSWSEACGSGVCVGGWNPSSFTLLRTADTFRGFSGRWECLYLKGYSLLTLML